MVNAAPFLLVTFIAGVSAALFIWRSRVNAAMADRIENTPTTPIRELCEGMHEVKGAAVPLVGQLVSPMTQKQCVYYHFQVKEARTHRSGKKSHTHWVSVINDRQSVPFAIDDGTGRAEILLDGADLRLARDGYASSGFLNNASPGLERLLKERYGRSSQGFIFNRSMEYEETVLEVGCELYVLGRSQVRDGRLVFASGGDLYLVTDGSEESLLASYRSTAWWYAGIGYVLAVVALLAPVLGPLAVVLR